MKRILLLLAVLVFVLTPEVKAQEQLDFESAYQDYVFTLDVYQKLHSEYLLAKAQYAQAGTLVSQNKAQEATVGMLQARDDVVITYLTAVKLKIEEENGLTNTVKEGLVSRVDAEVFWFQDHRSRVSSAGNLSDLEVDSREASDRFILAERIIYESLVNVSSGSVAALRNELNSLLTDIRVKTFEIKANGDHDIAIVEKWLVEIDNKIIRSLDKSIEAESNVQQLHEDRRGKRQSEENASIFNSLVSTLQESLQLVREGNNFMLEIIKALTTV